MDIDALKLQFRTQALGSNEHRRARLLCELDSLMRRFANERLIVEEHLSPEEMAITSAAIYSIQAAQLNWARKIQPGYWRRLWQAFRGK